MKDAHSLKENIDIINGFRSYMGGDKSDMPMNQKACDDMIGIARACEKMHLPQPEFFPYYDASGTQAEWDDGTWYMETDSVGSGLTFYLLKERDYKNSIECRFEAVDSMMLLVQIICEHVFV